MSNADRLIHYQTSFVIDHERDRNVPFIVKTRIWQWIDEKEHALRDATGRVEKQFERSTKKLSMFWRNERERPDSFYARFMEGRLPDGRFGLKDSSLTTVAHTGKNRILWGMEYRERRETGEWLTEVGLSSTELSQNEAQGKTIFYIRVSFLPLDPFATMPPPNTPRIVRMVVTPEHASDMFCVHGINSPFNYSGHPIVVDTRGTAGKRFEEFLLSRTRSCPIILLRQGALEQRKKKVAEKLRSLLQQWFGKTAPRTGVSFEDSLARLVAGKAFVFLIKPGVKMPASFMPSVEQLFLIPKLDADEELPSIKQYHLENPEGLKRRLVSYIYRRCPVVEPEAMSPETIRHSKELDEYVELSQEDSDDLNSKNMELSIENENLKSEVKTLREQIDGITKLGSLEEVLRFRWLWSNLDFADEFDKRAQGFEKDYPYAKRDKSIYREIFRAFCLLNYHLFERLGTGGDIENEAKLVAAPLYGLKTYDGLAMTEQHQTKKGPSFADERTFPYHGKSYVFWPHLKLTPNKKVKEMALRIHFRYFKEEGKVIVGYCGPHLRTYGSQYL